METVAYGKAEAPSGKSARWCTALAQLRQMRKNPCECERKTPLSHTVWGWQKKSGSDLPTAMLLSSLLMKQGLLEDIKYNSFFHTLPFQLPWNQNSGQTPGAEERRNIGLTVIYASESWGSQLLLCVLYLTRSCQDNIEKQCLYQGSELFFFFFLLKHSVSAFLWRKALDWVTEENKEPT